jgi:hypothetical protein
VEPKDETIQIRIEKPLKEHARKNAESDRRSLSQYVCALIIADSDRRSTRRNSSEPEAGIPPASASGNT